jgi:hypothetical protein
VLKRADSPGIAWSGDWRLVGGDALGKARVGKVIAKDATKIETIILKD